MNEFEIFVQNKPPCFAVVKQSGFDASPCTSCVVKHKCFSALWRIYEAIGEGVLPDNGYRKFELRRFKQEHQRYGNHHDLNDTHSFPVEVLRGLHHRALPKRSRDDEEIADLVENVDADVAVASESIASGEDRTAPQTRARDATTLIDAETEASLLRLASASGTPTASKPALAPADTRTYRFPVPDGRPYEGYDHNELVELLEEAIAVGFWSARPAGYASVRSAVCAISLELNIRGAWAPRFRPVPGSKRKPEERDEINLALDCQVIDIHWRAHSDDKPLQRIPKFENIFTPGEFDFDLAGKFAELDWGRDSKVTHLTLTEAMQWEHATLQNGNLRDRWRVIEKGDVRGSKVKQIGALQLEPLIRNALPSHSDRKKHVPGMVDVWKASKIVGDSPKQIARLVSLMNGKPERDPSSVRKTLTTVKRLLRQAKSTM